MPEARVDIGGLSIAAGLRDFVEAEALPGTGLDGGAFWEGFASAVAGDGAA